MENGESTDEIKLALEEANKEAKKYLVKEVLSENLVIAIWREAYKKFKTKKGVRCSIVLHPKSWTQDWRCSFFVSKLTKKDKIEIYERRKKGETISSLAKAFNIHESNIRYLISLLEKHGYDILRENKNMVYSKDFKLQTINRILVNHESIYFVAIDIGLPSSTVLQNWLSN